MEVDKTRIIVPLLAVITLVVVGMVLKVAQSVILPLMIAWLLSFIFGPPVNFLTRRKVPTALAIAMMMTIFLFICYHSAFFLYGRVQAFAREFGNYHEKLRGLIQQAATHWPYASPLPFSDIDWGSQVQVLLVRLSGTVLSFGSNLLMVIIFLVFLLLGKPYTRVKLRRAFSAGQAEKVERMVTAIAGQISRYLSVQFLISFFTGLLVWLALTWIGVDFAVTWGALAFFLNFIPTVGSIAASIPPILVALVQFEGAPWPVLWTIVALLTIQMSIGNVIAPKVMGDRLNLSPVVILLSLIFWGWLWGITGALLSVPIASAIKIVCENITPLHPIAVMMGSGRSYRHELGA